MADPVRCVDLFEPVGDRPGRKLLRDDAGPALLGEAIRANERLDLVFDGLEDAGHRLDLQTCMTIRAVVSESAVDRLHERELQLARERDEGHLRRLDEVAPRFGMLLISKAIANRPHA